jgi:hypothetical protein
MIGRSILDELRKTFRHVLVDDVQHLSRPQRLLLFRLSGKDTSILFAGDDDQVRSRYCTRLSRISRQNPLKAGSAYTEGCIRPAVPNTLRPSRAPFQTPTCFRCRVRTAPRLASSKSAEISYVA